MNRPYVICHMTSSVNGKVTGSFLETDAGMCASEVYYELNRDYQADGFACGRVTMEGSFTGGWYPDLTEYAPVEAQEDFLPEERSGFYAVAFDPHGRLGWKSNRIIDADEDPGYDKAQIIEVLTKQADPRYLGYLQAMGIPYVFAGVENMDVALALEKLKAMFSMETLLLEGGSILNGAFMEENLVDEISLVMCPVVADTEGKPLFMNSALADFTLAEVKVYDGGIVWLNYKKEAL